MSAFTNGEKVKVGFIGAGNMGSAIMKGIHLCLSDKVDVCAFDSFSDKLASLAECGVSPCKTACEVVENCKYIFLAVKPQNFGELLEEIKGSVTEDKVIVSIAAGITADYIRKSTIPEAKVVLVMPNTPFLLGEGATALAKCAHVSDDEFEVVRDIFETGGITAVVPENKMKEIIAVNGSSPAFIYLFAKGFVDYAVSEGIDGNAALELFAQSLIGSAKMLTDSGKSVDELIRMVSSPGGTTLKGLDELYDGNLLGVVRRCCESCTKRAFELSK